MNTRAGLTNARIRYLAWPDYAGKAGECKHNYVKTTDSNGRTVYVCTRSGCGHTIR